MQQEPGSVGAQSLSHVQLIVTLWVDCSPPSSMEIFQIRILERIAIPSSRGYSQSRDWTQVSRVAGGFFLIWATRESQGKCHQTDAGCTLFKNCEEFWKIKAEEHWNILTWKIEMSSL